MLRDIVGKKFKRDKSAEGDVFGLVNHAHAAATEFLDDAVVRDSTPDHARPITGGKSYVGEKGKSMNGGELASSMNAFEARAGTERSVSSAHEGRLGTAMRAATTLMAARPNTHTVL